jgi:hypothetical protein
VRAALRASAARRTAPLPTSFDVISIAPPTRRGIGESVPVHGAAIDSRGHIRVSHRR